MAHIRKHPVDSTKWQVRYRDPTGKERSKVFAKRTDADNFLIRVEAQKLDGTWVNPDLAATPFGEWAERWMAARSHLKPNTVAGYRSLLNTHILPQFGTVRLSAIRPINIEEWIAKLTASGLSPSRTRQAHQVVHAVLKAAVTNRYVTSNAAADTALPRIIMREMTFLDEHQIELLTDAVEPRYKALIYVLAYGGLRWGEAAALRRSRTDVLRGRIDIAESLAETSGRLQFGPTKNHRNRSIAMPKFLRDALNDHLVTFGGPNSDDLVFTVPSGSPLRNSNFASRVWHPAKKSTGLPTSLRIHDLRHTAVALMIAEGAHPEKIKRHLGHSSIVVTMDTYGHWFPAEDEAIADRLHERRIRALADNRRTRTN